MSNATTIDELANIKTSTVDSPDTAFSPVIITQAAAVTALLSIFAIGVFCTKEFVDYQLSHLIDFSRFLTIDAILYVSIAGLSLWAYKKGGLTRKVTLSSMAALILGAVAYIAFALTV